MTPAFSCWAANTGTVSVAFPSLLQLSLGIRAWLQELLVALNSGTGPGGNEPSQRSSKYHRETLCRRSYPKRIFLTNMASKGKGAQYFTSFVGYWEDRGGGQLCPPHLPLPLLPFTHPSLEVPREPVSLSTITGVESWGG